MAYFGANLELVPVSLNAKTEKELTALMFLNQKLNQTRFNYENPAFVKGKWVVWFDVDLKDWKDPSELKPKEKDMIGGFEQ